MSFGVGDEVMAPWADDGYLYPAIIVSVADAIAQGEVVQQLHVAYLDGDEGDVAANSVLRGAELSIGASVSVNWKGKGTYFEGVVKQRVGRAYFVHYEDGDKGWTTIAQVRMEAKDVMTAL
jgi:hypothetical protein